MKKILLLFCFVSMSLIGFSQYTPLSTILTYFETGDKPTQTQFITAWSNSYNSVTDGIFDLTGYPSIGFTPYSTLQVGKFSQGNLWPTDTTTRLIWNGTLVIPNLWVNGQKWTGTGSSEWTLNAGTLYPTSALTNVAINATSSAGYDLYVDGTANIRTSVVTNVLNFENSLGLNGSISVDGSGNLQFTDENTAAITLSSLAGSAAWSKVLGQISSTITTDTISVGAANGDSLFNVYGTAYVQGESYFDSEINAQGGLKTADHITTPALTLSYGANAGLIDLYNASGKITFTDSDFPTGVTLAQLSSGEWSRSGSVLRTINATDNVVIGGTAVVGSSDLTVVGTSNFTGISTFGNGMTLSYGSRINFSNGYITNSTEGLVFNDAFNGDKTLTELLGVTQDSMSVSRLNVDTTYFNGVTTKSLYSPHSNNIYAKINLEEFRFEEFEGGASDYGVFHSNAFLFSNLIPNAMQVYSGFAVRGRVYMSAEDSTFKYFTGKASEWRTLATEEWATDLLSGGLGLAPEFDTVNFTGTDAFITRLSTNQVVINPDGGAAATSNITFALNAAPYGRTISNIESLRFTTSGADTYMRGFRNDSTSTSADTAYTWSADAIKKYVSEHGGGGTGTPGGSANDLQYNDGGSFGGFWAYDGTNIVPTTATGLAWSATSFIKGHTADSVIAGKTVNVTNAYAAETGIKQNFKSLQAYAGGYLNSLSNVYLNYNDANANSGNAYGLYSHLYSDENYAATGNTSYSNAGRFILQNRGTTTIGGGTPGSIYMNAVYAEITGTINVDATPGGYILSAVYGKNSNAGTAESYAGYFDGNVTVNGDFASSGYFVLGGVAETGTLISSDWGITSTGIMTGITGITNDAAITSTGGIVSLNASSNFAVNLATGTSTGAISIGGGSNTVAVNSTSWDISTAGAVSGVTTLSMSGQLTNTLATGTSPFAVTSTTVNTNLNADLLDGQTGTYYSSATNLTGTLPGDRGVSAGSASSSFVEYNGTTLTASQFYGGTSNPTGTTRLNYGGYLYDTRHYSDRYYSNALSAITDTMAAVWYPGGYLDSATIAITASKGWEIELEDFDIYYSKAEQLKALPLPYPNGVERRKPNAMYANYQFEFELERLTRYFKEERDKNKILLARIETLEKSSGTKKKKNRR